MGIGLAPINTLKNKDISTLQKNAPNGAFSLAFLLPSEVLAI